MALLSVKNLTVEYTSEGEVIHAVNNVSFELEKGKTIGLVGETGAGKTSIARAILRILPEPPARVPNGEIEFEGKDLLKIKEEDMQKIRGKEISMIFQDPMTALNPIMRVGEQIAEVIKLHEHCTKHESIEKAKKMLEMVGIPGERYYEYPHQFSGGMKQRVVIAMALACSPTLLLADEPTTALDVSIQAQVLNLLQDLQEKQGLTYMFVTHDLSVVRHISDDICVMYLGQLVETSPAKELFKKPLHPYTKALLSAIPSTDIDHPLIALMMEVIGAARFRMTKSMLDKRGFDSIDHMVTWSAQCHLVLMAVAFIAGIVSCFQDFGSTKDILILLGFLVSFACSFFLLRNYQGIPTHSMKAPE